MARMLCYHRDASFNMTRTVLGSQDSDQSVWIDHLEDQENVEHKYNPRLSFEASEAEKQIPAGSAKKSHALFESKVGESKLVSTPLLGLKTRRVVSRGITSPLRGWSHLNILMGK